MHKKKIKWLHIEAIVIDIIIASIIVLAIIFTTKVALGKQIKSAINYLDMISIDTSNVVIPEIKFDKEKEEITSYPEYGSRYGNIKIDSIELNLPLYYGDKLEILRNGIGHSSGSYFPGEGGSILCMGHNTKNLLNKLPKVKNGDEIVITTTYGKFTYEIYKTKIINMYDVDEVPIQDKEEIFMMYTCYPVNTLGLTDDRFVVYAKRIYN